MVSNSGRSLAIGSLLALVAGFCGSFGCSDPGTVTAATGGSPATGGATVTGGTSTGGTTSTGGSAPNTGGVPSTGGTVSTGGTSSGGASSTGGASGGSAGAQGGSGTGGASGAAGAATGGSAGSGAATGGSGGSSGNTGGTAGAAGNGSGGAGGGAIGTGGSGGATTGGTAGASTGGSGGAAGGATSCVGNAVSFSANGTGKASDAAHARVMVDLMTDLPIANAHRTLEFWAYIRSTDWVGETNTIFEYGTQDTSAAGFGLDFGGNVGTIDPYTNGGFDNDNQATGLTTSMDQWVHFAMTWDGTAVRTYVNGAVKSTKAGSGGTTMLATVRTQLTIGCNNPRFSCFGGYIDEFRVWSVARSATEIMDNYKKGLVGNETGLVGYWRFNETTGNSAADSVTTANHTKHNGTLMSVSANQLPTFVASTAPITCP